MIFLVVVLGVASETLAAAKSARSCKSTDECASHGSSMISTRQVTVTAPGIMETYSSAKLADAPDAVMLAADDWDSVIEEEGTNPQESSASALMPPSRLKTFGSGAFGAYIHSAIYYACILMAGFLLAAITRTAASTMEKSDEMNCCRDTGSGDANETDTFGCTALHLAAHGGSADAVRVLLEANADANVREAWDETPLHFAARAGHAEVCDMLLKFGAEPNALNASGCTPLIEAARGGKRASCSVLLDHGGHAGGILDEQLPPTLSMLMLSRIVSAGQDDASRVPG